MLLTRRWITGEKYEVRISPDTCTRECLALEVVRGDGTPVVAAPVFLPGSSSDGQVQFVADGLAWSITFLESSPTTDEKYVLDTAPNAPIARSLERRKDDLEKIGIVPNPYYGYSTYEVGDEREVRFTNMPPGSTVSVFTLSGSKIRTLQSEAQSNGSGSPATSETVMSWDLRNTAGRLVGSGVCSCSRESAGCRFTRVQVLCCSLSLDRLHRQVVCTGKVVCIVRSFRVSCERADEVKNHS